MKDKLLKPPLGIMPYDEYKANPNYYRKKELIAAIMRYLNADCEISIKWIKEYNALCEHKEPTFPGKTT
jgi:hypothetical protein